MCGCAGCGDGSTGLIINNNQPGATGFNGWSPQTVAELYTTYEVLKIVDWVGGSGPKPPINVYIGAGILTANPALAVRFSGLNGWSPILAADVVSSKAYLKLVGWSGGEGSQPISPVIGQYMSTTGFVTGTVGATQINSIITLGTVTTGIAGSPVTITNTGTPANPIFNFSIPKGDPGTNGSVGRGITSITRTSGSGTPGTSDTYTITYSDASTSTFLVYNGADGTNGTNASVTTLVSYNTSPVSLVSSVTHVNSVTVTKAGKAYVSWSARLDTQQSITTGRVQCSVDLNGGISSVPDASWEPGDTIERSLTLNTSGMFNVTIGDIIDITASSGSGTATLFERSLNVMIF